MGQKNDAREILSVGVPLRLYSYTNWGLTREQAIDALGKLRMNGIPVLGGDVLVMIRDDWAPSGSNWYINREPRETNDEYVARSIKNTEEYLNSYLSPDSEPVLFALEVGTYF